MTILIKKKSDLNFTRKKINIENRCRRKIFNIGSVILKPSLKFVEAIFSSDEIVN